MRRLEEACAYRVRLSRSARSSVHTTKLIAIDRARSFHVARWSLETRTSVPVAPVWTRATGRELVAIDRARFGKVSCGHGLLSRSPLEPSRGFCHAFTKTHDCSYHTHAILFFLQHRHTFPGKKRYGGVRFNIISVTRVSQCGWMSNVQKNSVT